jgi:glutamate N-acetyltransferase/amino-acid N-acetyltransferase
MRGVYEPVAGAVAAPRGFRAAGVACGIKANGNTNLAQAAPILVSREHMQRSGGRISAIVVNSGCANACTGPDGLAHARAMTEITAKALAIEPSAVLVASTGVIGVKLPMAHVERGIGEAVQSLSPDGGSAPS